MRDASAEGHRGFDRFTLATCLTATFENERAGIRSARPIRDAEVLSSLKARRNVAPFVAARASPMVFKLERKEMKKKKRDETESDFVLLYDCFVGERSPTLPFVSRFRGKAEGARSRVRAKGATRGARSGRAKILVGGSTQK